MTFSYSAMNPNGLVCPAMEPSYSHSSEDSIQSFGYPDLLATSPAQDLDLYPGQTTFDPTFFDLSPSSQYPFPDVCPVSNVPIPIPGTQPPVYGLPSSFLPKQFCSSPPSPPLSPSSSPPQWARDESFALGLSSGVRGSPPETSSKSVKPFPCKDCGKAFTRSADLKRHQTSVHYPVFQDCPVKDCSRKDRNGFPRKDHLVEHLRSYHHLSVPKRRALKRNAKMHCF